MRASFLANNHNFSPALTSCAKFFLRIAKTARAVDFPARMDNERRPPMEKCAPTKKTQFHANSNKKLFFVDPKSSLRKYRKLIMELTKGKIYVKNLILFKQKHFLNNKFTSALPELFCYLNRNYITLNVILRFIRLEPLRCRLNLISRLVTNMSLCLVKFHVWINRLS